MEEWNRDGIQEIQELRRICCEETNRVRHLKTDELFMQQEKNRTAVSQLLTQIGDLQNKVNSLSDAREVSRSWDSEQLWSVPRSQWTLHYSEFQRNAWLRLWIAARRILRPSHYFFHLSQGFLGSLKLNNRIRGNWCFRISEDSWGGSFWSLCALRDVSWSTCGTPCASRQSRIAAKHFPWTRINRWLSGNMGYLWAACCVKIVKFFLLGKSILDPPILDFASAIHSQYSDLSLVAKTVPQLEIFFLDLPPHCKFFVILRFLESFLPDFRDENRFLNSSSKHKFILSPWAWLAHWLAWSNSPFLRFKCLLTLIHSEFGYSSFPISAFKVSLRIWQSFSSFLPSFNGNFSFPFKDLAKVGSFRWALISINLRSEHTSFNTHIRFIPLHWFPCAYEWSIAMHLFPRVWVWLNQRMPLQWFFLQDIESTFISAGTVVMIGGAISRSCTPVSHLVQRFTKRMLSPARSPSRDHGVPLMLRTSSLSQLLQALRWARTLAFSFRFPVGLSLELSVEIFPRLSFVVVWSARRLSIQQRGRARSWSDSSQRRWRRCPGRWRCRTEGRNTRNTQEWHADVNVFDYARRIMPRARMCM